jgi:putative spermidine/putrescine transport system permease protein
MQTKWVKILAWVGGIITALVLLLEYTPFLVMIVLSFQGPRGSAFFPLTDWPHIIWYYKAFFPGHMMPGMEKFYDVGEFLGNYWIGFWLSIRLAFLTMIISTVLGLLATLGLRRVNRGRQFLFHYLTLGLVIPGITLSLGLNLFFEQFLNPYLNISSSPWTSGLAAHVVWTFPYCFIIFMVFMGRLDPELEKAAKNLGANPIVAFFTITLPQLQPAIMSSMLFGFTLSLDEYARSVLLMGSKQTLPLLILATLNLRITPTLYALGTVLTLGSFIIITLFLLGVRLSEIRKPEIRWQEDIR